MRRHSLWLAAVLAGCAGAQLPREQLTDPGQLMFNGWVKSDVQCFKCHGGDGLGKGPGPDLREETADLSDEQIAEAIAEGPSIMPSYKGKLSDDEVEQLVAWLRTLTPPAE